MKQLPGGDAVQLTNDATKMHPAFSPDGSRVAYTVRTAEESWDTWEVPVLGGQPRPWLPNASGLTWIAADRILFSEIKVDGLMHMALETSAISRSDTRDIYVPANVRGMVHRSQLSPDRKWVLLTEMVAGWLPCRLVPFDGKSAGPVGPSMLMHLYGVVPRRALDVLLSQAGRFRSGGRDFRMECRSNSPPARPRHRGLRCRRMAGP